jgi:4-aminobutyrate aminotransferase-like enzyme
VVTTPAIAEKFSQQFHYFNTFGGNPVSTAVGLAVLDVIEQEGILNNVSVVGAYLGDKLKRLGASYDLIGDVRGKGLFWGLEIVSDPETRQPGALEAQRISEIMRSNGVLVSTTGPLNNVVKIRPPMVFSRNNAERLLEQLERALDRV